MADKRYIDADKLTFSRVRIIHSDGTIGGWHAVVMSSVIKDAPAADVVEVVRCKDCIYNNGACTHSEIYDDTNYNPDYYCADGERKE